MDASVNTSTSTPFTLSALPYRHAMCMISADTATAGLTSLYYTVLYSLFCTVLCELWGCMPGSKCVRAWCGVADDLASAYRRLLHAVGEPASHNVILTASWMLVVPRCRSAVDNVTIDGLAFAGVLFGSRDLAAALHGGDRGPTDIIARAVSGAVDSAAAGIQRSSQPRALVSWARVDSCHGHVCSCLVTVFRLACTCAKSLVAPG
jgi:hypothetical protein